MNRHVLIFGFGHIGHAFAEAARAQNMTVSATVRAPERQRLLEDMGIAAVPVTDRRELAGAVGRADGLLICPPPGDDGCPAFAALSGLDLREKWLGYLSTTGVYGNRDGGWVFEESECLPASQEARRRLAAETQWLTQAAHIFRLPGLYGPGRNVIERLRAGDATRIHKPGHVFSRLHHDDCATALLASLARPRPGGVYNLCDDEPASAEDVLLFACGLTGLPVPPEGAITASMARFYADNKRVSNARAKAELGWMPRYPTFREGLSAIYAASHQV